MAAKYLEAVLGGGAGCPTVNINGVPLEGVTECLVTKQEGGPVTCRITILSEESGSGVTSGYLVTAEEWAMLETLKKAYSDSLTTTTL